MRRGVTRPMAVAEGEHAGDHESDQLLEMHHRRTLWVSWTVVLLGFWLLTAPVTFGYGNEQLWATPSGGRGVWLVFAPIVL